MKCTCACLNDFTKTHECAVQYVNILVTNSGNCWGNFFQFITLGLRQVEGSSIILIYHHTVVTIKLFNSGLFISALLPETAQIVWLLSDFSPEGKKSL